MDRFALISRFANCEPICACATTWSCKGDTGLFILVPYDARDFETLVESVTAECVGRHLGHIPPRSDPLHALPSAGAMVVVARNSPRGGVTPSPALDAHGKTLSGYLLGMTVPWREH